MNRIPTSKVDFHALTREDQVRIYRYARRHAVSRECGLTAGEFDADMSWRAEQLRAAGWSAAASMTSVALSDYLSAHDSTHCHVSPETLAWSSMESTIFTTTENHAAAYSAIFAAR